MAPHQPEALQIAEMNDLNFPRLSGMPRNQRFAVPTFYVDLLPSGRRHFIALRNAAW